MGRRTDKDKGAKREGHDTALQDGAAEVLVMVESGAGNNAFTSAGKLSWPTSSSALTAIFGVTSPCWPAQPEGQATPEP
ncbi:hypothetical protein RRG08_060693 [Elysia crispata]|uniref:Uncharacterized protein n=1 Tax=Elysia crispata TaxID=231223 RepID=A0AAE0YRT7_9GAST|nr:hypothetical protein RRG08_060693 [Elysia crispata]